MMFLIIEDRREYISSLLKGADETFSYKGLKVYCRKDRCYLDLKDGYCLSDGRKNVCLEYRTYSIETPEGYYQLQLHVYQGDSGFEDYAFYRNKEQIRIAAREADVLYRDPYMGDSVFMIRDGQIEADIAFSVNGKRYDGFRLEEGDLICFLGLRIFYYGDFLYMNSFLAENRLERYQCKERKISYPKRGYHPRYRLIRTKAVLDIPELEEYETMEEKTGQDILKTILPNSIMSLAVLSAAAMSFYPDLHQGHGILQLSSRLISPLAMLVTGVLLPFLFYSRERKDEAEKLKKHKEGYLSYLKDYEEEIDQRIGSYVQSEQERDFSVLDEERDPFCLNAEDPDFLCLSIGRRYEKRDLIYKRSEDEQIDKRLEGIKRKLSEIGPLPLMVDLKQDRSLSIVCKRSEKDHFFTWLLLQLAYRHSCEDLYIGVYAKKSDLISSFYDLPHLFYEDRRLFFFDERNLKDVDLLRPEKPLVLFMYEDSDQIFSDTNIRVIRFLKDMDDLKKERGCVVEYLNQSGVLYGKERTSFIYRKEVVDLKKSFARLGRYNIVFDRDKDHSFRKLFGDLDLSENYQKKPKGLRADFAYEGDQLLSFDLHEKKQGPHGLIGGSTGSGKSELIISMLLSLCIRYSPDYLNIVLVDYKGGGIREALTHEGRSLPHIIAAVSNLEDGAFERLIIALKNECLRRQKLFNEMSSLSGMAVSDLDSYLETWNNRYALPSLAHLLIVIDEFAELKKEDPDGIRELISISRIGRSLGVHLILATQKPASNIDEEIWSNSHFKIALKVFEEKDSNDLIRQKDAAYLKEAGSFILKVDDHLSHAQSIYARKDYCDHEPYEVCILDPTLEIRKRKSIVFGKGMASSSVFVKRINEACDRLKMRTGKMDFLPPEPLERKRLAKGCCFVFGEADDYIRGKKGLVAYGLDEDLLVCSDRKKEINGLLNTLNENRRQTVLISHRRYEGAFISDSLIYDEAEDIAYLFDLLEKEDFDLCLLIEDLFAFLAYDDAYQDRLLKLIRQKEGSRFNVLCLSSAVQISFKLLSAFRHRVLIGVKEPSDIAYFFGSRSLYIGKNFYHDEEPICFVHTIDEEYSGSKRQIDEVVRKIPADISAISDHEQYLIGYDLMTREAIYRIGKLKVVSYDEGLLKIYADAYADRIDPCVYGEDELSNSREDLLWLGPGIFSQRLFFTSLRNDISDEEAVYVCKGRKRLLRRIDHA